MNKQINELVKAGFAPASTQRKFRMVVSVVGFPGKGKTEFGLTGPGPIAYFNLDDGAEGVIEKFQSMRGDIVTIDVDLPHSLDSSKIKELACKEKEKVEKAFDAALQYARTIVVDTETQLWELYRLAEFGRQSNVEHLFTALNAEYRKRYKHAVFDSSINVVYLHKYKKEYKNNNWTGDYELAGFGDMKYMAQVILEANRDEEGFNFRVLKCRQNGEILDGTVYQSVVLAKAGEITPFPFRSTGFPAIGCELFPESQLEDWL